MDTMLGVGGVLAVALVALALWWRGQVNRQAAAIQSVAENIRLLRRMAGSVPRLEPATASTPIPEGLGSITAELERTGYRRLGDLVEHFPGGGVAGVIRWFVSPDGRTYGWAGITAMGPAATLLVSEDPGTGFVTTLRAPEAPSVAVPENVRQIRVDWEEGLDAALRAHGSGLAELRNPVRVTDLSSARASFGRLYAQVGAWRSIQDPERLLEADVRKIVGPRFDDLGPTLITIVRALDDMESTLVEMKARTP
jgi:hypothetical protein